MALFLLLGKGLLDLLFRDDSPGQQQLAELHLVLEQDLTHILSTVTSTVNIRRNS